MINRTTIEEMAQNRPILVCRDLADAVPQDRVMEVLLQRGVFKWLAIRRKLIRLKDRMKREVTECLAMQADERKYSHAIGRAYTNGYRVATEKWRKEIRALCHSPRWQAPDNDKYAQRYLASLDAEGDDAATLQGASSDES